MVQVVTGESVLVDDDAGEYAAIRTFFEVADERGHGATSVVVDERGQPVTHPWYCDRMGAPHLKAGAWAFCRQPRAEALGLPLGTDFTRAHAVGLMFGGGSPYLPEPHFYTQLYVQPFGEECPVLQLPLCSAGAVAWRGDGRRICVIEERLGHIASAANMAEYVIWEYDLALGQRRRVADFPEAWKLGFVELTYSGDEQWLHLCDWAGGRNFLVRLVDGLVVTLPFASTAAGWNPRGGPGAMIVTTVDPLSGRLLISDYDVTTNALVTRSDVESPNGMPLTARELSMSVDGRSALVTAPLGVSGIEQQRRGGVHVAVVIDVDDGHIEPVLPVRFRTPRAQRRHTSPRWCEAPLTASAPVTVADALLEHALRPECGPDDERMRRDHLDRWLEIAVGIEQAWATNRIPATRFVTELVQHTLSAYDIDEHAAEPLLHQLREQAKQSPTARALVRWIEDDRRRGWRSTPSSQLGTLGQALVPGEDLDTFATEFDADRRRVGPLLDQLIAAEIRGEVYQAARGLVGVLSGRPGTSDVTWQRLAILTAFSLRQGEYLFAAKAGLALMLWNGFFLPQDDQLRASGLDTAPPSVEMAVLIDCFEACTHLDERAVVGADSTAFFDAADVRNRAQVRLQDFDMRHYLTTTSRAVAYRPLPSTAAPDPTITQGPDEAGASMTRKRIFVSYVREDSAAVDELVAALGERGFDVWMDRTHLLAGQKWKSEIRKAIRSGDYFLACFSPANTSKLRSYMNEELIVAAEQFRLMPRGHQWLIPVVLAPCEIPDLPIGPGETLDKDIQFVDLSTDWTHGIQQLLRSLGSPHAN